MSENRKKHGFMSNLKGFLRRTRAHKRVGGHSSDPSTRAPTPNRNTADSKELTKQPSEQFGEQPSEQFGEQLNEQFGEQLSEPKDPSQSFGEILQTLVSPELAAEIRAQNLNASSDPNTIKETLIKIGKTSWVVFKRVLEMVKGVSDACPHLKMALEVLFTVLEGLEIMEDAQKGFEKVSLKLSGLQSILHRHRHSPHPRAQERLESFAGWANSVRVYIEMHTKKNGVVRFFIGDEERDTAIELLRSLDSVIDFFMLDITLNIEDQVKRLDMKVDDMADDLQLQKLDHVKEANWEAQKDDKCLTGTRCVVLSDLMKWCRDPEGSRVFWLCGMAGTGKSAIARTLCDNLNNARLLGGSFFCSRRGSAAQRDITRVIPTLVRQLARLDPHYRQKIVDRLKENSDISTARIDRQLEELLVKPCSDAPRLRSLNLVLVIDALDEGAEADDTCLLLEEIFARAPTMPFRFFVTSRPESHIRDRFLQRSTFERTTLRLHDIEKSMVKADIRRYIEHRLEKVQREKARILPEGWPDKGQVEQLVDRAETLFIYAFTACNYISSRDPVERLRIVLQVTIANNQPLHHRLDEMYTLILDQATNLEKIEPETISDIRKCLAALICIEGTLSVADLSALMGTEPRHIRIMVEDLHSLVLVPELNDDGPVTTLHASLGDYLNDKNRSKHHAITKESAKWIPRAYSHEGHRSKGRSITKGPANEILLRRCFQVLDQDLCFNVSRATTSFLSNDQQKLELPHTLVYSAANWARHIAGSYYSSNFVTQAVIDWVKNTLIPKFLFWLEVISVAKKVDDVQGMLWGLVQYLRQEDNPEVVKFLYDALYFVNESHEAIRRSTPHIYLSALALCRQESAVKKMFENSYGSIPLAHWDKIQRPIGLLFRIGKHVGKKDAFDDWDLQSQITRLRVGGMEANPGPNSVVFSLDGRLIASCSDDMTVRVWDVYNGRLFLFQGHIDSVKSVEFSPDAKYIVSGSLDKTMRIWSFYVTEKKKPVFVLRYDDVLQNEDFTALVKSTLESGLVVTIDDSICFSPHLSHSFALSEDLLPSPLNGSTSNTCNIFTIYPGNSGWILGPQDELFLWIPTDVRSLLWLPQNTGLTSKGKLYLDLSKYSCGPRWTDCNLEEDSFA